MAPRKPKPADDDTASTTSTEHPVLKPNTTKSKIEKPKTEKPKAVKAKAVKKIAAAAAEGEAEEKKAVKSKVVKKDAAAVEDAAAAKTGGGGGTKEKEKGEKVKPVTGEEAVQLILSYLTAQNRPYSATDVSANLHGKVTKTTTDKLLKEMEQAGQIMGKATKKDGGGQWVFWAIQDPADTASPDQLKEMDSQISALREAIPGLKSRAKEVTSKLTTLQNAPTMEELGEMVARLQRELGEKRERVEGYKGEGRKVVTREESEKVEREWKYWGKKRGDRKKGFLNLEAVMLEGELKREDLWERAGLEEDVM
ncbi:TBPIP-domain-containing protein [Mollisia scopiformis]|uniref:TBPIP-domain-containing protein n=1 Tax=Mollisia scopiformis TaxID=149040 RepID=A0A194X3U8_MOLSC|nr:TBPIP-domain-containing protein [Mollisia scopiformis]KUJ14863.1 TBPIP-domain-containing protein [Mollisia scopiformis]